MLLPQCVYQYLCVFLLLPSCVESKVRRWYFSCHSYSTLVAIVLFFCAVFLSFSSSLSYYFCSCCLKDCSYPSTFFMFLFFSSFSHLLCVQLHLCLHFSLIVLPFGFLFPLIVLWFGIYVFLRSVNTTLMGYFPTGCH